MKGPKIGNFRLFGKISVRLSFIVAVVFVIAGAIAVLLINNAMRLRALDEAEAKARIILNRNLATHTYFTHQLKPHVFPLAEKTTEPGYFDPVWMSSTYAIREINKYFRSLTKENYYYKECAINARSGENEADDYEKAFIGEMNRTQGLVERAAVRSIDGGLYFQVLRRNEVMEQSCMQCHSLPASAPEGLVTTYGPEKSFHRNVGDVISAISIRIPLSEAYAAANKISALLSLTLLALLVSLFGIIFFVARRMVFAPLENIRGKALEISESAHHLGEQIPVPNGQELSDLAETFNAMSSKLRDNMDNLEEKVRERTAELRRINERILQEIDEREQAEALLASEKAFTESIIEAAQAILLILDCNGKIVRFNRYMENLSGYSLEEARGKDWFETFLPGRDRDRIKELFLKSVGGSKAHGFVNPIVARNGREILIEWNDHPLKDNRGNLIGLVSVGQDVTERMRDEAVIQDHRVHLALINRILRHDVSNDLGVIKSALRLFLSSKEERFLLEASERVDKSVSLIQDMKRYENIITAGSELKSLRLAPAINEIVRHYPQAVATIGDDIAVWADEAFGVIVDNILSNAVDHGKCRNVEISVVHEDDLCRIRFADDGQGIPENLKEKVVKEGFTTDRQRHSGLGLFIVNRIVERYGGSLRIEDNMPHGTIVIVALKTVR